MSSLRRFLELTRAHGLVSALRYTFDRLRFRLRPAPPPLSAEAALSYYQGRAELLPQVSPDRSLPGVSILVLTYNHLLMSQVCLHSIYCNTTYPNFEVIVVDNGSTDGTPEWLQTFARAHPDLSLVLNSENRGFAAGNNQGARQAAGDYLVFLNNDTIVTSGWIEGLLAYLQADPNIGLVGPVTNSTGNEARIPVDYDSPAGLEAFAARLAREMPGRSFDIRSLALYCAMARRDQFLTLGGLDERFGAGMFEDEDLAVRYQQAGLRLACAEDVFIHHFWRAVFGSMEKDRYDRLFNENRRKFEEKWGRKWQPYQARPLSAFRSKKAGPASIPGPAGDRSNDSSGGA
jgi:GT2 family glycosyltransferase